MQDAVERWDAQVVHAHGIRAASLVAAARVDAKSAVTVHGLHAVRRSRGVARVLAEKVSARVLRSLDIVFCTGRSDLDTVRRWGIERSTELRWIHSAFTKPPRHDRAEARARLGIPLSSEMVLWMGRFEHQKNPQLLLRAAERLKDRTGLALVMAGDGPLHAEVAGAVKGSALEDVVMLPGWIDDPSWAFAAADVYVSTARWEGFPLTCLEAASSGLPMVITDSPGNRDLVEVGLDVMPVAQDDPRRVADAIALALETRPADMGRRNAVLKDFSIEVLGEEVLAGYEDVLGPDPV